MKNTRHKQKDYLGDWHKTAVTVEDMLGTPLSLTRVSVAEVEDMFSALLGLTKKTVKPRDAEVGHVQFRQLCSSSTRGGEQEVQHQRQDNAVDAYREPVVEAYTENAVEVEEAFMDTAGGGYTEQAVEGYTGNAEVGNEVQGGGDFIIMRVKIYMNLKQAESLVLRERNAENFIGRDEIYIKAGQWPTGGLHNILRYDYEDIDVQAEFYNYKEVVSQPTTKKSMVVYNRKAQYEAVLSARVEDMSSAPLSLTKYSVTEDSSKYDAREEVLAELGEQLRFFPPTQREKKYEVAEQQGEEKYNLKGKEKDKKKELEDAWKMQTSRIYQLATQSSL